MCDWVTDAENVRSLERVDGRLIVWLEAIGHHTVGDHHHRLPHV